jgi:hypothetical protein
LLRGGKDGAGNEMQKPTFATHITFWQKFCQILKRLHPLTLYLTWNCVQDHLLTGQAPQGIRTMLGWLIRAATARKQSTASLFEPFLVELSIFPSKLRLCNIF